MLAFGTAIAAVAGCAPALRPGQDGAQGGAGDVWPERIGGIGTEPFWALAIDGTAVRFTTPEEPEGRSARMARTAEGARLVLAGTLGADRLRAELAPATCSDGMSDRVWPYTLTVVIGGRELSGCAAPRP